MDEKRNGSDKGNTLAQEPGRKDRDHVLEDVCTVYTHSMI
jgi:hypothetical protein